MHVPEVEVSVSESHSTDLVESWKNPESQELITCLVSPGLVVSGSKTADSDSLLLELVIFSFCRKPLLSTSASYVLRVEAVNVRLEQLEDLQSDTDNITKMYSLMNSVYNHLNSGILMKRFSCHKNNIQTKQQSSLRIVEVFFVSFCSRVGYFSLSLEWSYIPLQAGSLVIDQSSKGNKSRLHHERILYRNAASPWSDKLLRSGKYLSFNRAELFHILTVVTECVMYCFEQNMICFY